MGKPYNRRPSSPTKRVHKHSLKLVDCEPYTRGGKRSKRRVVSKRWVRA